ncbi:MAG: ATP-binding protein [Planctomycetes bacterium]|nr:ATP-binding protein [Planctomycetota bacterium]MBM4079969.1 ATP-binding protein [Planctomycetota bacterium]MBM4086799.1 ATP-binding protein [Planctomycetota bacterium]
MFNRTIDLAIASRESCFLWGPRQVGKSTLLSTRFPDAPYYDLLLASEYRRLLNDPGLLRQECDGLGLTGRTQKHPVIIDEIQKLPELLDEAHWLMTHRELRFILSGSSARKLKRRGGHLLGGRAVRLELLPLTSTEIPGFSLDRALNHGLLPRHYLADDPRPLLHAYVGDYLREEIYAESLVRNLPGFQRFLDVAALSNGQMVNYTAVGRDLGVSAPTVRGYFEILTDTLLGVWVPAWRKRAKRRVIQAPRFYFFDVGVVNELARRGQVLPGSAEFGAAFEHFIFMELRAHASYSGLHYPVAYWHTASGFEVDFMLAEGSVAVEAKSTDHPTSDHLRGLRALKEDIPVKRAILVSRVSRPRKTEDGIEVLPWDHFLRDLWAGRIVG